MNPPCGVLVVSSALPGAAASVLRASGVSMVGEVLVSLRITESVQRLNPQVVVFEDDISSPLVQSAAASIARRWPGIELVASYRESETFRPVFSGGGHEDASGPLTRQVLAVLNVPLPQWGSRPQPSGSLVAIGCSTGGPSALDVVLGSLPASTPVPVLVVQHMPAEFTKLLAARLDSYLPLRALEAEDGAEMEPGTVYVAPGDRHLMVDSYLRLAVVDTEPVNACRPSVDVLFGSLAGLTDVSTVAVLLSGMGNDGTVGAAEIVRSGGRLLCQDEETSVVWGMPGSAVSAGIECAVLPLPEIGPAIIEHVGLRRA